MERRRKPRKKVPANIVYVYHKGRRLQRCRARDISQSGVFIDTPSLAVALGAKVQLLFVLSHGKISRIYRKSAMVTRLAEHGAGFGFLTKRPGRLRKAHNSPTRVR